MWWGRGKVSYTTSGSVSLGQLLGMQLDFSFQKCFPGLWPSESMSKNLPLGSWSRHAGTQSRKIIITCIEIAKMWRQSKYPSVGEWLSFSGGSVVKNLPAKQETRVRSLGWEDPLEKEIATHCRILGWEIPRPGKSQLPRIASWPHPFLSLSSEVSSFISVCFGSCYLSREQQFVWE